MKLMFFVFIFTNTWSSINIRSMRDGPLYWYYEHIWPAELKVLILFIGLEIEERQLEMT